MSHDEQILSVLNKILHAQNEMTTLQRQAIENQRRALEGAQTSISNQLSTGRLYRISLAILGVILALFLYKLYGSR